MERLRDAGSLSAAAVAMNMSYRRAWTLVRELNGAFRAPLVHLARGGATGGTARLTSEGDAVLAHYRALEAALAEDRDGHLAAIAALLSDMSERR
jgi:molybdate transport system regulatory protein